MTLFFKPLSFNSFHHITDYLVRRITDYLVRRIPEGAQRALASPRLRAAL
jgi:hypothetical protein